MFNQSKCQKCEVIRLRWGEVGENNRNINTNLPSSVWDTRWAAWECVGGEREAGRGRKCVGWRRGGGKERVVTVVCVVLWWCGEGLEWKVV